MRINRPTLWIFLFAGIFLLTQDYLFVEWNTQTGFLGLPNWFGWFVFVHGLFLIVFSTFIKKFWKEKD